MNSAEFPDVKLGRYLAQEMSEEERAAFEGEVMASQPLRQPVSLLRRIWDDKAVGHVAPAQVERVWGEIAAGMHEAFRPGDVVIPRSSNRASQRRFAFGASAMAIAGFAVWFLAQRQERPNRQVHSYATGVAERAHLELPDGSHVLLAPDTKLRFSVSPARERVVELNGQASFTVMNAGAVPFTVRSGKASIRVLGTEFTVRHYAGDPTMDVAVVSGKVSVHGNDASLVLTPGLGATVSDSGPQPMHGESARALAQWAQGLLAFTETPVPALLKTVGRWYGYTFQLADSALAQQHVTVVLAVDKPDETLRVLKELLDVRMVFQGKTVVLMPSQSHHHADTLRPVRRDVARYHNSEVGR